MQDHVLKQQLEIESYYQIAILKLGINLDVLIGSILVYMYATCGSLSDVYKLFDGLRVRNVVS